jgi:hypothetical protein
MESVRAKAIHEFTGANAFSAAASRNSRDSRRIFIAWISLLAGKFRCLKVQLLDVAVYWQGCLHSARKVSDKNMKDGFISERLSTEFPISKSSK